MKLARTAALGLASLAFVATACPPPNPTPAPGAPDPTLGGCPMMPADNYWHADVSALPVHPRSAAWVASIGTSKKFHTDFGSGLWDGGPIGIPYSTVSAGQPKVPISFYYPDESDPGPYPLAWDSPVEGGQGSSGDRHVLTVDTSTCTLYEVYDAHRGAAPLDAWTAGSGAVYDLRSNAMRPDTYTSADAAGLPILPGLVRFDEVASGRIDHAIRFTAPRTQKAYIWPAKHQAGSTTDPNVPPMGAWFRLRADYPTAGLAPQAKVIVEAMKTHGIVLADNGSSWYMSGAPDERWDNDALTQVWHITGADMVAVDTSTLMVSPNSGQIRR
ncbi:MAG: hypothetical protein K1X38_03595 [Microthrixaceae bacterium]|nr:hypothetical protein [Microthrixaceae bacterium]